MADRRRIRGSSPAFDEAREASPGQTPRGETFGRAALALSRMASAPERVTPAEMLSMQRAAGNGAVTRLLDQGRDPAPRAPAETPAAALDVLASPGRPLDPATRARLEERFGYPLDGVRIHTGAAATAAADALGADAYTLGRDIVLADGITPGTARGNEVLAHELAHVVATERAGVAVDPRRVTPADDASELQADEASRGGAPGPLTAAPVGLALRRRRRSDDVIQMPAEVVTVPGVNVREPEVVTAPAVNFRRPSVVEGSSSAGLDRRGILTAKRSATETAALSRLSEIGRYTSEAVTDFWASVDQRLGGNVTPYAGYAATVGGSALAQAVRINLVNTPYPGGLAAPLGAGLPHTAITLGALLAIALVLIVIVETNNGEREVVAESRARGLRIERALSRAREIVKRDLVQRLDELFADPANISFLLDIEVTELVDALGFPADTGPLIYTPIRQSLEESFALYLALDRTPVRDFSLREVERARAAARRRTREGAAERGYEDEP